MRRAVVWLLELAIETAVEYRRQWLIAVVQRDRARLPRGLCSNRKSHQPHRHESMTLGIFWCEADQSKREPWASEQREMRRR